MTKVSDDQIQDDQAQGSEALETGAVIVLPNS